MGIWNTIKGWLNIGGVKVQILKVEDPFYEDETSMSGSFLLTTETTRTVLSTSVEFYVEETTGTGEEKKTTKTTLGTQSSKDYMVNDEYPFELAAGERKELNFVMLNVDVGGIVGKMAKAGGMLVCFGQAASFAGSLGEKGHLQYFVEVSADVKGTPLDPSAKVQIRVMPRR